uniref:Cadherin domain-containing protein n=1 Tax=Magnetococcus massalia (strain MO-1) TaxID=451514 RepID=A0A1S7LN22_MAGMO|nr:Protein of unknown function. Containing four cadherin domains and two bacterial pre-peptidase C-terminal domains [Candidatus Magnetococcus massalia]
MSLNNNYYYIYYDVHSESYGGWYDEDTETGYASFLSSSYAHFYHQASNESGFSPQSDTYVPYSISNDLVYLGPNGSEAKGYFTSDGDYGIFVNPLDSYNYSQGTLFIGTADSSVSNSDLNGNYHFNYYYSYSDSTPNLSYGTATFYGNGTGSYSISAAESSLYTSQSGSFTYSVSSDGKVTATLGGYGFTGVMQEDGSLLSMVSTAPTNSGTNEQVIITAGKMTSSAPDLTGNSYYAIGSYDDNVFLFSSDLTSNTFSNTLEHYQNVNGFVTSGSYSIDSNGKVTVTRSDGEKEYGFVTADERFIITMDRSYTSDNSMGFSYMILDDSSAPNNSAPSDLSLSNNTVIEESSGATVGTLSATDSDSSDSHTFAIISDSSNKFEISGTTLKLKSGYSADYETASYHYLTIRATDSAGATYDENLYLYVTDISEVKSDVSEGSSDLPSSINTTGYINIGSSATGYIGYSYDADWFEVELTGGVTYRVDIEGSDTNKGTLSNPTLNGIYSSSSSYQSGSWDGNSGTGNNAQETITPSSSGSYYISAGSSGTGTYTVSIDTLSNIIANNSAPTDISLSNNSVDEGSSGASIGTLSATDSDSGDSHSFSIVSDSSGLFTISNTTLKLASGSSADYETATSHSLTLRVTDSAGSTYDEIFTISINDISEIKSDVSEGNDDLPNSASTSGYITIGSSVTGTIGYSNDADAYAIDLTAGTTYQVDVEGADTNKGTLANPTLNGIYNSSGIYQSGSWDGNSGTGYNAQETFTPSSSGTYYISVGSWATGTYTVSIAEDAGNSSPTDINLNNSSVSENNPGATIGTLSATDPDSNDSHTFSIVTDSSGLFEISGTTLRLKSGSSADYETANSHSLTIRTTDSAGNSYDESVTVTVTDVVEDLGSVSQVTKFLASDAQSYDYFGRSIAIDGNYAIVGAYGEDTGGSAAGAAYIFQTSDGGTTWTEAAKIQASDAQTSDYFGSSVAIDGNYAIVGAYQEDTGGSSAGAAYIFQTSDGGATWTEAAKVQASDAQPYEFFGYSVAIDGNYAIVGAYRENTGGSSAGAAYVFQTSDGGTTWAEAAKIQASDAQAYDNFGGSVAINGNYAIVGASGEDTGAYYAGAAYVFQTSDGGTTWTEAAKLQASDAQAYDEFGLSVAIDGNYAIVGAYGEDTGGSAAGAAYIFQTSDGGTTWTEAAKIQASDAQTDDSFGRSVAIDGNYAIVGAWGEDTGGSGAGAAYIFQTSDGGTTWTEAAKLQASDAQAYDEFGLSVAIDGNYAIVGAYGEDTGGSSAGAAYLFSLPTTNQTPTDISLSNSSIAENSTGAIVGTLSATDPDSNDSHTFSIVTDSSGLFEISGTTLRLKSGSSADYETANSHSLTIRTTDSAGNRYDESVTVTVTDVVEDSSNISQLTKILASDAQTDDHFGRSVAVDGNYAIISADYEDTGGSAAGAAYIFQTSDGGTTWTEAAKIQASDAQTDDSFGRSVAIDGNYAIVGAWGEDTGGSGAGAAYIFQTSDGGTTWTEAAKIQASDAQIYDYFGQSVAIDGNYAIVGAYGENTGGLNAGAAYIFQTSDGGTTWTEAAKIQASDAQTDDSFGYSVAIDGNYAIVGAYEEDTVGVMAGAAYIFQTSDGGTTWTEAAKIQASDAQTSDYFGYSVAIDGNYAIVGAWGEDTGGESAGAAYVFQTSDGGTTWTETAKIQASDSQIYDYFGHSVAIDGNYAIVSAWGEDTGGSAAGAAYVFQTSDGGTTWTEAAKIQASDSQIYDYFGLSVAIDGNYAIVGAEGEDTGGSGAGAAYVFSLPTNNSAPTDIILSNSSIAENSTGAIVGTLSATDPDSNDSHTFSIVTDSSGLFEISNTTLQLVSGNSCDYETATSHDLTVRVTDSAGTTYDETVTITVTDVNENSINTDDYSPFNPGALTVGSSLTGTVNAEHDTDWFSVTLTAGTTYQVDVKGSDSGAGTLTNPTLNGIHDSNGWYISGSYDANSGNGNDAQESFTPSSDGTYYLVAGSHLTGTYTISIAEAGSITVTDDYAATTSTTGTLNVGSTATGSIEESLDSDWFAVTLSSGSIYTVDVEGSATSKGTLSDPTLYGVYDSSGSLIPLTGDTDSGTGANAQKTFVPTSDGTYYLSVSSLGTGSYSVGVSEQTSGDDYASTTSTSGQLSVGSSVTGSVEESYDTDWFAIYLTGGTSYQVDVEGSDTSKGTLANPTLFGIHDSDGTFISKSYDGNSGTGFNAQEIFTPITSGVYYISAGSHVTGSYTVGVDFA